jgi:hypothetical protein
MMKTAIFSLAAVAASASPVMVHLNQENPSDINDYSRLRGGRELGKRERNDAAAAEESLIHAMEAEAALVDAVETEKELVQKLAKAEKELKNKEKEKRAKEKKDKKDKKKKHGVRDTPTPIHDAADGKKKHLQKGVVPPSILMAKTSKPTSSEPDVSAPLAPENVTERGWLKTLSPSTMIPSFQPTISPTTEFEEKEGTEPPSLAPITSEPTVSVITPVPTSAPITSEPTVSVITPVLTIAPVTSAPVATDTTTSLPTFVPSYSPTGGEGETEATPTTTSPSTSVVTVTVNSTADPVSSPPTSATSSVASITAGVVAPAPTTPSPTSSLVTVPPVNSTISDDSSEIVPDCPAAYDATKTTYVGGDEATVNEHIFECQTTYEKYCNIPEWDDTLLTGDANAKESWNDAWMHIGPCVAVTADEV